jgi:hypothetical protein
LEGIQGWRQEEIQGPQLEESRGGVWRGSWSGVRRGSRGSVRRGSEREKNILRYAGGSIALFAVGKYAGLLRVFAYFRLKIIL